MAITREELKRIIAEETRLIGGGTLEPERLLKRAKAKDHPLHAEVWGKSDRELAMSARLDICRVLITTVWVEVVGKTTPGVKIAVPMMVHDTRLPAGKAGFRMFTDVAQDRVESYATLEVELKALRGHYMRAMSIAEGLGLVDVAQAAVAQWDTLMGQMAAKGVRVPVGKPEPRKRRGDGEGARA